MVVFFILDIIILSYNDELGLYNTLMSLGTQVQDCLITIIDDASKQFINYTKILNIFKEFYPINFIQNEQNIGAESTRQKAFEQTFNEFILFIDGGDIIISPTLINYYTNLLKNNQNIDLILPACYAE